MNNPHVYIPKELQNNEEVLKEVKDFVEQEQRKNPSRIADDMDAIGEVVGVTLDDTMSIAETVGTLMELVMAQQVEIEQLKKGGN